jgi:hypothetical protein
LPKEQGVPLSRFSRSELHRFVIKRGVSEASASTVGRWLAEDAIKPWQQRSWISPRDLDLLKKAGRVLDLIAVAARVASSLGAPVWVIYLAVVLACIAVLPAYDRWDQQHHP